MEGGWRGGMIKAEKGERLLRNSNLASGFTLTVEFEILMLSAFLFMKQIFIVVHNQLFNTGTVASKSKMTRSFNHCNVSTVSVISGRLWCSNRPVDFSSEDHRFHSRPRVKVSTSPLVVTD